MLSLVTKANRGLLARLYPTTLAFKDGSTITIRYHEPRQILTLPLTLEECTDSGAKNAWQIRRRAMKLQAITNEEKEIKFDARKYLRPRKK